LPVGERRKKDVGKYISEQQIERMDMWNVTDSSRKQGFE